MLEPRNNKREEIIVGREEVKKRKVVLRNSQKHCIKLLKKIEIFMKKENIIFYLFLKINYDYFILYVRIT